MSTLKVDNLQPGTKEYLIPLSELTQRGVKRYRDVYQFGSWTASTSYTWMPGGYADYTPARSDSRLRFTLSLCVAHAGVHAISHNIFYANEVEIGRHSISGYYNEHKHTYVWDVASWGTYEARIGYRTRNYGTANQIRLHGTYYWDGVAGDRAGTSEIVIEEYTI